jgi:uncharacterized membrane protein YgaE (UPF0421/DUF939 family)
MATMQLSQLRFSLGSSLDRVRNAAWPVAQAAGGAGVAWFLAHTVLGHPQPLFAPIAAVVGLAANIGGRGRQTIELLVGVGVGVAVGAVLVLVLALGAPQLALTVAVAMLAAAALVYSPLPLIQAGASAVLVIVLQSSESGGERVLDALVGGGVALLVSQILFSPSPHSLLAEAGRHTLGSMAEGLRTAARALADGNAATAEAAIEVLREGQRTVLSDFATTRETAEQVARRTLRGRREADRLRRLGTRLGRIDLLFGSAISLARVTHRLLEERGEAPGWLARTVNTIARAVEEIAEAPESTDAAGRARRLSLEAAEASRASALDADLLVALAAEEVHQIALDVLRTAGEEADPAASG